MGERYLFLSTSWQHYGDDHVRQIRNVIEKQRICDAKKRGHNCKENEPLEIVVSRTMDCLDQAADQYLWEKEQSSISPDRQHLAANRAKKIQAIDTVLDELGVFKDWLKLYEKQASALETRTRSAANAICHEFGKPGGGRLNWYDVERSIVARFLKGVRHDLEREPYTEKILYKREGVARNEFLHRVFHAWADALQKKPFECEISEVESGPMMSFILAAFDPVVLKKEKIGAGQLKKICVEWRDEETLRFRQNLRILERESLERW